MQTSLDSQVQDSGRLSRIDEATHKRKTNILQTVILTVSELQRIVSEFDNNSIVG